MIVSANALFPAFAKSSGVEPGGMASAIIITSPIAAATASVTILLGACKVGLGLGRPTSVPTFSILPAGKIPDASRPLLGLTPFLRKLIVSAPLTKSTDTVVSTPLKSPGKAARVATAPCCAAA
jgi:hypothetical protein